MAKKRQAFSEQLDLMIAKKEINEFAALREKAKQLGGGAEFERKIKKLQDDADKEYNGVRFEEKWKSLEEDNKVIEDHIKGLRLTNEAIEFQSQLLGKTAQEQAILTNARQVDLATEAEIAKLARDKNGFLIDPSAIDTIRANAEKMKKEGDAAYKAMYEKQRLWSTGAADAFNQYTADATNAAKHAQTVFTDMYKGMEDALVNFVKTGKLDFKSLADSIINDLIRIQIQQRVMPTLSAGVNSIFGSIFGGSSAAAVPSDYNPTVADAIWSDSASAMLGFANGGDPPVGVPSMVGERGPELFIPKAAGTIIPNSALGGGGGVVVHNTYTIDARGADPGVVEQMRRLMNPLLQEQANTIRTIVERGYNKAGRRSGMAAG